MIKMITAKQFIEQAKKHLNEAYVYGCKHEVLTKDKFYKLQKAYGKICVWDSDINKVGTFCCDCSGLIGISLRELGVKGYMIGSSQFYERATRKEKITTYDSIPVGACVWRNGHIGIYIGNGKYIAEDGSAHGCRIANMYQNNFTHYLLFENIIDYKKEGENMEVKKVKVKFNGNQKEINAIYQDGHYYFMAQDLNDYYLHTEYDQVAKQVDIECRA